MQIEAWLFLAAIILEVVLVVVDLIVWRVYSNSMANLKEVVLVYKTAYLATRDSVKYLYDDIKRHSAMIKDLGLILDMQDKQIDELLEKGASDVNRN